MPTHFRTLSLLTFGASILLGACTIIQDPVTPINPPDRQQPAPQPATPPPRPATAATPAPATPPPAEPGVAVPAPPVATPIPGTTATPTPGTAEPAPPVATPGPVKPKRPIMRIPRLPARPVPVPGTEAKPPNHEQPVPPTKREPVEAAPSGNGRADGAACSTSSQCASGICEGMGCGWDQGKCAPAQRSCTRDLRLFCGCDGKDFQSSSTCPGRVFRHPGSCNPNR